VSTPDDPSGGVVYGCPVGSSVALNGECASVRRLVHTECGDVRTGDGRRCVRGNVFWAPVVSIDALLASWSLRRLVQESVAMPVRVAHGLVRVIKFVVGLLR